MEKKVVFTIVAKNYLPLARALGWSLREHNKTAIEYIIFLADEEDGLVEKEEGEVIIPVSSLGIENLKDWAFKYNVTEFCTSVKPTCFKYIFDDLKAESAIYFDPDIFVFNDLSSIFNDLENKDIVVTPHYTTMQKEYSGDQYEGMTLFVGIFNFGFVAFNNTPKNIEILDWWENRLSNQCYADRQDALHTDQKWADFLPVFAGETLHISKSLGYNLAPWNLFEREIFKDDLLLKVKNRFTGKVDLLTFVHFAGYDPNDLQLIHKDFWNLSIAKYPEYDLVRKMYNEVTASYKFKEMKSLPYSYSQFSNGDYILDYHRRLYRSLVENGTMIKKPFDSDDWFYQQIKENKMITKGKPAKLNSKNYNNFESNRNKINTLLKIAFKFLGSSKYFLLMSFLNRYSRSENQTFLLKKDIKKIY